MSDILFRLNLPRDTPLSYDDVIQALLVRIDALTPGTDEHWGALFELTRYFGLSGMVAESLAILEILLEADIPLEKKAQSALIAATGIEMTGDFDGAILAYRRALSLIPDRYAESADPDTAYFAHNNLAYSLNQVGSFEEGEAEARAAIAVDPNLHNAHKNLGVALEGRGRLVEAGRAYVTAVQANPLDGRSLQHLEAMVKAHPEVLRDDTTLGDGVEIARNARKRLFEQV